MNTNKAFLVAILLLVSAIYGAKGADFESDFDEMGKMARQISAWDPSDEGLMAQGRNYFASKGWYTLAALFEQGRDPDNYLPDDPITGAARAAGWALNATGLGPRIEKGAQEMVQGAAAQIGFTGEQAAEAMANAADKMLGEGDTDSISSMVKALQKNLIDKAQEWGNKMSEKAKKFFWYLALISLFFAAIMPLVSGSPSVGTLLSPVIQWIVVIGIFYFVLEHGPEIFLQTQQWFTKAGTEAVGVGNSGPLDLIQQGVKIFADTLTAISNEFKSLGGNPKTTITEVFGVACFAFFQLLAAGMVAVVMCIAATQFLSCIIMAYIIAYAGAIVLGFGGHRLGHDIVIGYFRKAVSIGLQLLAFHFLCAIGSAAFTELTAKSPQGAKALAQIVGALLAAVVLHRLFAIVPHELGELAGRGMNAGPVVKFGDFAQMGGLALTPVTAGASAAAGSFVADMAKANAEKGGINVFYQQKRCLAIAYMLSPFRSQGNDIVQY